MIKTKTEPIETKRLLLRPFKFEDANDMFKNYCNSDDVCKFLPWNPHGNVENTKEYLKTFLDDYENKENFFRWAIVLKEINEVVGVIDLHHLDLVRDNCGAFGYVLGKNFWNKGIMSEAGSAVVEFMFENTTLERLEATHVVENIGSGRVMQKIGMKFEGIGRHLRKNKSDGYWDFGIYALIREDYENEIRKRI